MLNESTERVAEALVLFRTLYVFIEQMYNHQLHGSMIRLSRRSLWSRRRGNVAANVLQ